MGKDDYPIKVILDRLEKKVDKLVDKNACKVIIAEQTRGFVHYRHVTITLLVIGAMMTFYAFIKKDIATSNKSIIGELKKDSTNVSMFCLSKES